jgi:hypothetical protein
MRPAPHRLLLLLLFLITICWPADVSARDGVVILDQSIRAVSRTSSGRFVNIAWNVKLKNEADRPQTCAILVSFLDADDRQIGKATKTQLLKARELKTVTDTVRLRSSVAERIATCDVSVAIE